VKFAGVAALKDPSDEARVRNTTIAMRTKYTADLEGLGFKVIPSQGNFFMVNIRRPVQEVIPEFRQRGVLVGRAFPPMNDHMRISIGLESEMTRFMTAFREIFTGAPRTMGG
jgi:histidinol-phosphate aminotransferase